MYTDQICACDPFSHHRPAKLTELCSYLSMNSVLPWGPSSSPSEYGGSLEAIKSLELLSSAAATSKDFVSCVIKVSALLLRASIANCPLCIFPSSFSVADVAPIPLEKFPSKGVAPPGIFSRLRGRPLRKSGSVVVACWRVWSSR